MQRLGEDLFAPFGDYAEALHGWLRHPGVRTTVAMDDGAPVGFAMVSAVDGEGYLLGIGVAVGHRRAGLGGRLLEAALEAARGRRERWGISRVDLDVAADNAAAIGLFERAGFERVTVRSDRYVGGQPVVTMRRALV